MLYFRGNGGGALILISYIGWAVWGISHSDSDAGWVRPWLIRGWYESLVFFAAGVWIRFNGGEALRISRGAGLVILAMGWGCLAIGGWWFVVGLPLAMGGMWYSLSERAWPKMLTSCSFPIYVLHAFMGVGVSAAFAALGIKEWADEFALAWGVKWSVMAGASIVTTMLARRFLPKMSAVVFGGR